MKKNIKKQISASVKQYKTTFEWDIEKSEIIQDFYEALSVHSYDQLPQKWVRDYLIWIYSIGVEDGMLQHIQE